MKTPRTPTGQRLCSHGPESRFMGSLATVRAIEAEATADILFRMGWPTDWTSDVLDDLIDDDLIDAVVERMRDHDAALVADGKPRFWTGTDDLDDYRWMVYTELGLDVPDRQG